MTIELSIDPNVVPDWGLWEAFREILQGAIDADVPYTVSYNEQSYVLTVRNKGKLSRASLLIGHSTKRNDRSKIGQHGEGYKLAATILLRLDKPFSIYNDDEVWTFQEAYSRKFKSNVISLRCKKWFTEKTDDITWEVKNILPGEYEYLQSKIQDGGDILVPSGHILLDKPGQIYSGGLFVCQNEKLSFGYNFNPGILALQRDRNLISEFDILWETTVCWKKQPDFLTHVRDGLADVTYANSLHDVGDIKNAAFEMFFSEHGRSAVPCSQESHKVKGAKNIIVPRVYREAIVSSPLYCAPVEEFVPPHKRLSKWYENARLKYSFSDPGFEDIIEEAKNWS